MKAVLTRKGAKRINLPYLAGQEVEIDSVATTPDGARFATVLFHARVVARNVQLYTPGHGKNCGLIATKGVA